MGDLESGEWSRNIPAAVPPWHLQQLLRTSACPQGTRVRRGQSRGRPGVPQGPRPLQTDLGRGHRLWRAAAAGRGKKEQQTQTSRPRTGVAHDLAAGGWGCPGVPAV